MARQHLADGGRGKCSYGKAYALLLIGLTCQLQHHPTTSPTLVGMLTGVWCPHSVSLTQEHDSMSMSLGVFNQSCTAPVLHRSTPQSSEGHRIPLYYSHAVPSSRPEHENVSLLAHIRAASSNQNDPYAPHITCILPTLTVAWSLACHTVHYMSGSMSGPNAQLHVQPLASPTPPRGTDNGPSAYSSHSSGICPAALEMTYFRATRWPGCLAFVSRSGTG